MRNASRAIVLALAAAAVLPAWAGCDAREYAQYRDRTRTKEQQLALAKSFCLNRDLWEIHRVPGGNAKDAEVCGDQMTKILDALSAANAKAAIAYIEKTCPIR